MLLERATDYHVSVARTPAELEEIAEDWTTLWRQDPRATPFQSPAWLIPWARQFTNGTLCCVCVRQAGGNGKLEGLVPSFIWFNPEMQRRELLLLGTGISDYCDGIFSPQSAPQIASAVADQFRRRDDWDVLHFQEIRADSPLIQGAAECEPQSTIPVVTLLDGANTLSDVLPKAQLQNLNYYRKRAQRLGQLQWQMADEQTWSEVLDELFNVHAARWRQRNGRGLFEEGTVRRFHREAAGRLLRLGALRLYRLTVEQRTVAVFYGFTSHRRAYFYISGFDPEFATISPGTLVIGYAIEQAIRERCTHFDFLRGAEPYKYLWGAKDTQTFRCVAARAA